MLHILRTRVVSILQFVRPTYNIEELVNRLNTSELHSVRIIFTVRRERYFYRLRSVSVQLTELTERNRT